MVIHEVSCGAALLALLAVACGGADDRPAPLAVEYGAQLPHAADSGSEELTDAAGPVEVEQCQDGETRKCTVYLGEHQGVTTCFTFEQRCNKGKWGRCADEDDKDQQKMNDGLAD